ncbi:uncharacterized protein [Aristolochia californica]|uniref:uncharacterized protein n=1 Tax=Aristolochia californica TaxID=171875 RepID=UPI0035D57C81
MIKIVSVKEFILLQKIKHQMDYPSIQTTSNKKSSIAATSLTGVVSSTSPFLIIDFGASEHLIVSIEKAFSLRLLLLYSIIGIYLISTSPHALLTACHIINRLPSSVFGQQTPSSCLFSGDKLFYLPLRVFGYTYFVHNTFTHTTKLDPKSFCSSTGAPPGFSTVNEFPKPMVTIDDIAPHGRIEALADNTPVESTDSSKFLASISSVDIPQSYQDALQNPRWKEEKNSPVAKLNSLDVKNVFLNFDIKEKIYMQEPPGYVVEGELHTNKGVVLLVLYVDDIILTGSDSDSISEVKNKICNEFKMKDLGLLKLVFWVVLARCLAFGIKVGSHIVSSNLGGGDLEARLKLLVGRRNLTQVRPVSLEPVFWVKLARCLTYSHLHGNKYKTMLWSRNICTHWQTLERFLSVDVRSSAKAEYKAMTHASFMKKTKYIEMDYHFVREKLQVGMISLKHVSTHRQLVDMLTKSVNSKILSTTYTKLGLFDFGCKIQYKSIIQSYGTYGKWASMD